MKFFKPFFIMSCFVGTLLLCCLMLYKRMMREPPPFNNESTPLTWSAYLDSRRENYCYPDNLREWLFNGKGFTSDDVDILIDPPNRNPQKNPRPPLKTWII